MNLRAPVFFIRTTKRNIRARRFWLRLVPGFAFFLGACAAPDSHPFAQYSTAVKKADTGLVSSLDQAASWSRDDYIRDVLRGKAKLSQTAVLQETERFRLSFRSSTGPIFQEFQQNRALLLTASAATEKYVDTLVTLAGTDLIDPNTFQTIAQDTDTSLTSIAKTIHAKVPDQAIPIFATASSEVMRLLIEHRRRAALEKLLETNQRAIERYCNLCAALLAYIDQSVSNDYRTQATALVFAFDEVRDSAKQSSSGTTDTPVASVASKPGEPPAPVDLTDNAKARGIVEQLLQLNTDYRALIESLESATKVYAKLPDGHRELLQSVRKQATGFAAIKDIAQEGERLKNIYDSLQKSGAKSSDQKTKEG